MKCYAKSSENLIVQLANLPPKPPFLSKSFHLFSCTGKTHYLCISSAKNKEQNKTFLPFNFQNIGRQLVQYALTEEHIQFYKPLVRNHYLPAVELYIIRDAGRKIVAFMGLSDELIEMLFVNPGEQGKGYGKRLLEYATRKKQLDKVDVNEQNEKALSFYLHMGFQIIGRDETDGMGKPYPILHLQLKEATVEKSKSKG